MKPRTLTSVGAVLLYLWCELFQASPFVFVERDKETAMRPASPAVGARIEDGPREELRTLFARARSR